MKRLVRCPCGCGGWRRAILPPRAAALARWLHQEESAHREARRLEALARAVREQFFGATAVAAPAPDKVVH